MTYTHDLISNVEYIIKQRLFFLPPSGNPTKETKWKLKKNKTKQNPLRPSSFFFLGKQIMDKAVSVLPNGAEGVDQSYGIETVSLFQNDANASWMLHFHTQTSDLTLFQRITRIGATCAQKEKQRVIDIVSSQSIQQRRKDSRP